MGGLGRNECGTAAVVTAGWPELKAGAPGKVAAARSKLAVKRDRYPDDRSKQRRRAAGIADKGAEGAVREVPEGEGLRHRTG